MSDELMPVDLPDPVGNVLASVFGVRNEIWTSLDKRNPKHAMLYMRAINNCDKRFDALLGTVVDVAHIFAHRVEMADETGGEVNIATRCVLITEQGDTIECVSNGVARDVAALAHLFGEPPWEPPMRVKLQQKSLPGGKRMFTLELCSDQPAGRFDEAKPSKKK